MAAAPSEASTPSLKVKAATARSPAASCSTCNDSGVAFARAACSNAEGKGARVLNSPTPQQAGLTWTVAPSLPPPALLTHARSMRTLGSSRSYAAQQRAVAQQRRARSVPAPCRGSCRHRVDARAADAGGAAPVGEGAAGRQVLFNNIAPVYDTLNDVLSLGLHRVWKARRQLRARRAAQPAG